MRLDRLRGGELLAGAGGLLLFGTMFLPWFGKVSPFCVPLAGFSCGHNSTAWEAFGFTDVWLLLAAVGAIVVAIAGANSKTDAQITSASMTVPLGFVATLLVLYRVLEPPDNLDPRIGLFLGLGACVAITYGCWRAVRNERPSRVARPARRRSALRTR